MSCEHCCYSCTEEGEDMTMETVKNAFQLVPSYITIGGGEPTLHPQFLEILVRCMGAVEVETGVHVITNGSNSEIAKILYKLAKAKVIGAELSLDDYHDPIDPEVKHLFMQHEKSMVRNIAGREVNAGRCDFGTEGCVCPDTVITPNGDVWVCGCEDSPVLGNVNDPDFDYWDALEAAGCEGGDCYKGWIDDED